MPNDFEAFKNKPIIKNQIVKKFCHPCPTIPIARLCREPLTAKATKAATDWGKYFFSGRYMNLDRLNPQIGFQYFQNCAH
jgi:hypothetical protein